MKRVALLVVVLAAGCGNNGGGGNGPDAPGGGGDDAAIDASIPEGWSPLIARSWSLVPSQEGYKCKRIQITEDLWIAGFRALSPIGTHHEVLTISDNAATLGDYDCQAGTLDSKMLYAAGVSTDDLMFPAGVAIHLTPGQYINLNLHLFNLQDSALGGDSGVLIKKVAPSAVVHEADMMFAGTFNIAIPADGSMHTAQGGCTAPADWHLFTLWPHMHQYARHQTLSVTHGSVETKLLDDDYQFSEQKNYPIAETVVHAGDVIRTTCSYLNNSAQVDPPAHTITFGDSSTAEMCFTGMYKWPAGGSLFQCAQ